MPAGRKLLNLLMIWTTTMKGLVVTKLELGRKKRLSPRNNTHDEREWGNYWLSRYSYLPMGLQHSRQKRLSGVHILLQLWILIHSKSVSVSFVFIQNGKSLLLLSLHMGKQYFSTTLTKRIFSFFRHSPRRPPPLPLYADISWKYARIAMRPFFHDWTGPAAAA